MRLILAIALVSAVVATGLAELVLRMPSAGKSAAAGKPLSYDIGYVRSGSGWTFTPNARHWFIDEKGRRIDIAVDELGYRNPPRQILESDLWVVGDSFAAAVNTPEAETLVGRLRASGIRAYNAGSDGTGTLQQAAMLDELMAKAPRKPKAVAVLLYLGNDIFDNLHAATNPSFATAPGGVAAGTTSSGRSEPYVALRAMCEALEVCKALHRVVWQGWIKGYGRDPWFKARWVEFKLLEGRASPRSEAAYAATGEALRRLAALASRDRLRLLVVGIPSAAQAMESLSPILASAQVERDEAAIALPAVDFDRIDAQVARLADQIGVEYVSLTAALRPDAQRYFGQVDFHWNAAGQGRAAEALAPRLRRLAEDAP